MEKNAYFVNVYPPIASHELNSKNVYKKGILQKNFYECKSHDQDW